ncbi:histo-blood group ABO system transferase 2-like [Ochotona princeps]|uniref:histo-blood group ABO system transferase 2-like n=1 Tax=Ochotona princeps TaxID=9978 RepID=UPI002714877E|nr:histo-blood group ABO system transferase 2-like [Ochotona princeps]
MAKLLQLLSKQCYSLQKVIFLFPTVIAFIFFYCCYLHPKYLTGTDTAVSEFLKYSQPKVLTPSRKDVLVLTPWLAPIVWEGTFDINLLNKQFRLQNATVGLTVFAVNKYILLLEPFLKTAEKHFMVGHSLNYYIFTDQPHLVPQVPLEKGRQVVVLRVPSYDRWEDISMNRMEIISNASRERFFREVDYLVCTDVDLEFSDHVGVEILSSLFATIHQDFFVVERQFFTNERKPESQAYISEEEGDFYYTGALFGGSVREVYRLTRACYQAIKIDKANHLEAEWQEESHLNKYLLYHKPTKLLSPEYMCYSRLLNDLEYQQLQAWTRILKRIRIIISSKKLKVTENNASPKV